MRALLRRPPVVAAVRVGGVARALRQFRAMVWKEMAKPLASSTVPRQLAPKGRSDVRTSLPHRNHASRVASASNGRWRSGGRPYALYSLGRGKEDDAGNRKARQRLASGLFLQRRAYFRVRTKMTTSAARSTLSTLHPASVHARHWKCRVFGLTSLAHHSRYAFADFGSCTPILSASSTSSNDTSIRSPSCRSSHRVKRSYFPIVFLQTLSIKKHAIHCTRPRIQLLSSGKAMTKPRPSQPPRCLASSSAPEPCREDRPCL